jgi:molybdopterin synthase catalytic subunit
MQNDTIIVRIQTEQINVADLIAKSKDNSVGAISIFLGTTRDFFGDKKVLTLFYEAHPTMALKKLRSIAEYSQDKWGLNKVIMIHRIGEVVNKK